MKRYDAAIVGGGIIGLASAWRAAQRGLDVCVVERDEPGSGATWAAAGVLAPGVHAPGRESPAFTALARRSWELWPAFAAELGDVGYTECGSLTLAFGEEDAPADSAEWVEREACLALEPGVSPACSGAWHRAGDAQVDPRRVVAELVALLGDAIRSGCDVVEAEGGGLELADGSRIAADRVVLAAGAWSSRRLARLLPIRPVKGQTVRLRGPLPATRIIRSADIYVVPRASGETVVGATAEEAGFDTRATDEATDVLLREAIRAVPAVADLRVVQAVASVRPGTPDGEPLIGEWEGMIVAGGHYRNGILLAPVTAEAVAALLAGEEPTAETAPFSPQRFD